MVQEHLHVATRAANGLSALPGAGKSFASTQAAWRFFGNEHAGLPELARPLIAEGLRAAAASASGRMLVVHDWSTLAYGHHASKADRLRFTQAADLGYELAVALLVDAEGGEPLAPLEIQLRAADGVHSTRDRPPEPVRAHVDQVLPAMDAVASLGLTKPIVHVIDREADSIGHYRDWAARGHHFLVRADGSRVVLFEGSECKLPAVVAALDARGAFASHEAVDFRGATTRRFVAEAAVVLHRRARRRVGGRQVDVPGPPLPLRLVICQLRDDDGVVLAGWLLLSNAPESVTAEEIGRWYLHRWRIETYFKLLKTAGQELESWQQESAGAIARRLLVASMACVLIWRLARQATPEAAESRAVLVRLSGRQMKHGKSFTEPALLAGLHVLLSILDLLEHHDLEDLRRIARQALPFFDPG